MIDVGPQAPEPIERVTVTAIEAELHRGRLRKGQAAMFNLTLDMRGEARIIERAFGLCACILIEAMQVAAAPRDRSSA